MTYYSSLDEAFPNRKNSYKDTTLSVTESKKKQQRTDMMGERERVSYRSQLSDYDYVCKTTGVCPLEEFTISEAQKKCEPLQPPKYEYPLNDKDKEKFRKALQIALEQMEDGPTPKYEVDMQNKLKNMDPPPALSETPNYGKPMPETTITGIFDEELEKYLQMNDFRDIHVDKQPIPDERLQDVAGKEMTQNTQAPFIEKPKTIPPPEPKKDIPSSSKTEIPVKQDPPVKQTPPDNYTKKNKIWMNLLLFISGGVLFIFLLEQLYRLAIYNGLKKTVESLEFIIAEAKGTSS